MDRKMLTVFALILMLSISARVFAFDEKLRSYELDSKVQVLEDKVKADEEKMNALANKANQLEARAIATDARLDFVAAKLNDLQLAQVVVPAGTAEDLEKSDEKLKKRTSPNEPLKSL